VASGLCLMLNRALLVSVLTAVAQLLEAAGPAARVCRVMPNTPCLVGETAAAMCLGGKVRHCSVCTKYSAVTAPHVQSKHCCTHMFRSAWGVWPRCQQRALLKVVSSCIAKHCCHCMWSKGRLLASLLDCVLYCCSSKQRLKTRRPLGHAACVAAIVLVGSSPEKRAFPSSSPSPTARLILCLAVRKMAATTHPVPYWQGGGSTPPHCNCLHTTPAL
jgi:hypothetical protein